MPKRTCSIESCESPVVGRGWCRKHYLRWYKTGDPLKVRNEPIPLTERFWSKVARTEDPTECWLWTAGTDPGGYGRINTGSSTATSKNEPAHRVAWSLANGMEIPSGLHVLHLCDTPPCCNPHHLVLGTPAANVADMVLKGRHSRSTQTHCKYGHEFTPENTAWTKKGARRCRACRRIREWGAPDDRVLGREPAAEVAVPEA